MTALRIGASPRILEADLALPAGTPRAAAVVCHPHPLYGGDMDNPVVRALASGLVAAGVAVLRFNFGGVGGSDGAWGEGTAEVGDVRAALAALDAHVAGPIPRLLAGYSFGAWAALRAAADGAAVAHVIAVAPPLGMTDHGFVATLRVLVTVVVGDRDAYCPAAALDRLAAGAPHVAVHRLAHADHFFAGREGDVAALAPAVMERLAPA